MGTRVPRDKSVGKQGGQQLLAGPLGVTWMDTEPLGKVSQGLDCAGVPNWLETPRTARDKVSATHQKNGSST